jgi:hypothetical protein
MRFIVPTLLLIAALLPASAQAAPPTVTTGGVADVTQNSATLQGKVDPNGNLVSIFFQFGPTTAYGSQTTEVNGGAGTGIKSVTGPVTGLTPFTKFHYRLVARFGNKTVAGKDRTFTTKRQPLGLSLTANPSQVSSGGDTTLSGNLAGTGNAGKQVVLQSNPWPYTQGFVNAGNPQVVGATGDFAFPVLGVSVSTQYRVLVPDKPEVVSPVVFVGVRQSITTKVSKLRRHRYRFSGKLTPPSTATVSVQRRVGSTWKTIESDVSEVRGNTARYSVRVKIRRKGTFRIAAIDTGGQFVPNVGRSVKVRPKR